MAAAVAAGSGLQALLSSARKGIEGSGPLLLAIGNEAADADSIISALGLAALVQQLGCSAQPVPLASCPRAQGALKPELAALLKHADMTAGDLLYVDDFPWADAAPRAQVALVDHNDPEGAVASHCSAEAVVAILDHHVDGGACKHVTCLEPSTPPAPHATAAQALAAAAAAAALQPASGRCVAFDAATRQGVGSTCSLVGYAFACSAAAALGPDGAAHALPALLGSVILLDTARLQDPSKTTPLDIAAVAALSAAEAGDAQAVAAIAQAVARGEHVARADVPPAWATLYAAANAAKFDPAFWAALTLAQALRMDTKVRPCTGGGGTVAVAAVLAPLQSLLVQGGGQPPLAEQALGMLQEAQADTLVIMTLTLQDGTPHRQLALLTPPTAQHMHAPLLAAVNAPEAGLDTAPLPDLDTGAAFSDWQVALLTQGNASASRKVVLPLLQAAQVTEPRG